MRNAMVSLNDNARVVLTPTGLAILRRFYHAARERMPVDVAAKISDPVADETGFHEFTLWRLMEIFGPHIHALADMPFDSGLLTIVPHR